MSRLALCLLILKLLTRIPSLSSQSLTLSLLLSWSKARLLFKREKEYLKLE